LVVVRAAPGIAATTARTCADAAASVATSKLDI
jgi:hypothetical protein